MMTFDDYQERAEKLAKLRENLEQMESQLRSDCIYELTRPMVIDGWRKKMVDLLITIGNRKE